MLILISSMRIRILKNGVLVKGKDIPEKFNKYGRSYKNGFLLSNIAFLYLVEKEYFHVEYDFRDFLYKIRKHDKKIFSKYLIFKDLVERGYFVEEGYGKNIDFLVYDKGDYPDKSPSIRVIGVEEGEYIKVKSILENLYFSGLNKKHLIIAVIERRGEVVYYSVTKFGDLYE